MKSDLTPISTGKPIGEADLVNEHRNLVNYTFAAVYDEDKPVRDFCQPAMCPAD